MYKSVICGSSYTSQQSITVCAPKISYAKRSITAFALNQFVSHSCAGCGDIHYTAFYLESCCSCCSRRRRLHHNAVGSRRNRINHRGCAQCSCTSDCNSSTCCCSTRGSICYGYSGIGAACYTKCSIITYCYKSTYGDILEWQIRRNVLSSKCIRTSSSVASHSNTGDIWSCNQT